MFKVKKEKCDQCLFTENRIVSKKRASQIIRDCKKNDTHFICHKSSIDNNEVCCRGSFDSMSTNLIRIAGRLNMIVEVD